MPNVQSSPEYLRAQIASANPADLFGRWITLEEPKLPGKRFIFSIEAALLHGQYQIVFGAVNTDMLRKIAQGRALPSATESLKGTVLSFSNESRTGILANSRNEIAEFALAANQSQTPAQVREQLKLLQEYPAGQSINGFYVPGIISLNEAIISGYNLSVDPHGLDVSMTYIDPQQPEERQPPLPLGLFKLLNMKTASRACPINLGPANDCHLR
jgi:hypothetical protein